MQIRRDQQKAKTEKKDGQQVTAKPSPPTDRMRPTPPCFQSDVKNGKEEAIDRGRNDTSSVCGDQWGAQPPFTPTREGIDLIDYVSGEISDRGDSDPDATAEYPHGSWFANPKIDHRAKANLKGKRLEDAKTGAKRRMRDMGTTM